MQYFEEILLDLKKKERVDKGLQIAWYGLISYNPSPTKMNFHCRQVIILSNAFQGNVDYLILSEL